jgi:HEAT repeat protein
MTLLSALVAISAIAPQTSTLTLAGRVVQVAYPQQIIRQVPEDVKTWDGFQGVTASQEWPAPFQSTGDWTPVVDKLGALGPVPKEQPEWKVKIFILTQADTIRGDRGVLRQSRYRLDQKQVDSILRALARVPGYARAATKGAVAPKLDVVIDSDPVVFGETESRIQWLTDYVSSRVNNGQFDADDKEFRGPFQSTLVIVPGKQGTRWLPNSRAAYISTFDVWSGIGECYGLEEQVCSMIAAHGVALSAENNIYQEPRGGQQAERFHSLADLSSEVWKLLQTAPELSFDTVSELYKQYSKKGDGNEEPLIFPWRQAPISPNVELSIVNDDQRGGVLQYGETSVARGGGFALPFKNVSIAATPYLSFWVKTTSRDDLGIHIADDSSLTHFGRRDLIVAPHDGAWHQVVVDLRHLDRQRISDMYIGPMRGLGEPEQIGKIIYLFDDFQLLAKAEPNQPAVDPLAEVAQRALTAQSLTADELLKDSADLVKLNGLVNRKTTFEASDELALIELTKSINVRIAGEAVKRLAQLGTPTAKAEVLRLVTSSPFEYVKQVAGVEVGKMADPKTAGILSRLFASKSWQTRMAGAQGVTSLPGDEAAVISMTFLQETDPQVRLVVTRGANTQSSVVIKRLLWSTVNDPSDAVRSESAWKLINSGKAKEAAEGYKAIRDDSVGVRLNLLSRFASNPGEGHRGAIRIAITDLSPRVRAAALLALSKQTGEVALDEIANTLEDKYPIVQLALLDLAKAKSLSLPANAAQALKASIDPRVVEGAKGLGL